MMFKNYNCINQGVEVGLKQVAVVVCSRFLGSFPPLILYSDCNLEIHNLVKWHHDNTVLEKNRIRIEQYHDSTHKKGVLIQQCSMEFNVEFKNNLFLCKSCYFLPASLIVNENKILICRCSFLPACFIVNNNKIIICKLFF